MRKLCSLCRGARRSDCAVALECARALLCLGGASEVDTGLGGVAGEWGVSAEGGDTDTVGRDGLSAIGRVVGA